MSPKATPLQKGILWACIVLTGLILCILGIVLTIHGVTDEGGTNAFLERVPTTTTSTRWSTSAGSQSYFYNSPYGRYRFAAVVGDGDPCSTAGTDILAKRGGSAVDAAIAGILCLGVVNFHGAGIGGGNFMTIYDRPNNGTNKEFLTILARERAPRAATQNMFQNASSLRGGLAIGVPGEVKGLYEAWQRYGRLPWRDLVQPSINVCQTGLIVNEDLATFAKLLESPIRTNPGLSALLIKNDGSLVQSGDRILRPKLLKTLETIATSPTAFYDPNTQLAKDIMADLQEAGSIITMQDMSFYQTYTKPPISVNLKNGNYTVHGPPPPSGSLTLQYILNVLDGYNFSESDMKDVTGQVLTYHRIAEAYKYGFAKRSELADEEFVPAVLQLVKNLTSDQFADDTRNKIDDVRTYNVSHYEPAFQILNDAGTAHINVLAPDGSAVAVTSTINFFFGAHVVGNRTGILFNNEMDDFSTPNTSNVYGVPASPANFIEPGKMPLSSMAPTLVTDSSGKVVLASGSSGGTWITTSIAMVIIQSLWFGQDINIATDIPRVHHQLVPNHLEIEPAFNQDVRNGLRAKGHTIVDTPYAGFAQSIFNGCNVNTLNNSIDYCIMAVSDGRKSGHPDGY